MNVDVPNPTKNLEAYSFVSVNLWLFDMRNFSLILVQEILFTCLRELNIAKNEN